MNIKHRCPCGATIEVTHLSTKPERVDEHVATADKILDPWLQVHRRHREAAHEAHVANLESRGHQPQEISIRPPQPTVAEAWTEPAPAED